MRRKIFIFAGLAVLEASVLRLTAQAPSEQWKAKNSAGDRYEGIGFDRNVTTFGLELISLAAVTNPDTQADIDISKDDEIVVDFASQFASPYRLIARELDRSEHYWMEPKKTLTATRGRNTFSGIWKTDVLRRLKQEGSRVTVDGLGVLVWFREGDDRIAHVAPAVMRASRDEPPDSITSYRATFLPDVLFSKVGVSVRAGCDPAATVKPFPGGGSVGKQYPGISFPVEFTIPTEYSGPVMLEIATPPLQSATPKDEPIVDDVSRYCFVHARSWR